MRFMLIDRIIGWDVGETATAVKSVALSEDFFEDHFPYKPIMPGVLMLEGMAQLSGILLEESVRAKESRNVKALMTIVERAKFRQPVYPGAQLTYNAKIISFNELGGQAEVFATVNEQRVAECKLVFSFREIDNPNLEKRRSQILDLWLNGCR